MDKYEEANIKRSEALRGRVKSDETRARMRKPKSDEARQNMRQPKSEEHRARIAAAVRASWDDKRRAEFSARRTGEGNPSFGTHESEELKQAKSERFSGESNPFYGQRHSEEFKQKQSAGRMGKCAALKKYGVSEEEYQVQNALGNRWCFFGKHFVPEKFLDKSGVCEDHRAEFRRKSDLKKHFGIDQAWYDEKLADQDGVCAICGNGATARNKRHLCIDHNHATGALRGILCAKCNTSIERLETIPNWTLLAINYLSKYGSGLS
jgi:Recombination endonuclease VII/NUMOD3 motif